MKLHKLSEDEKRKLRRVWDTTRNKWVFTREPEKLKEPEEFHVDDQFGIDPEAEARRRARHAAMTAKLQALKDMFPNNIWPTDV